MSKYNNISEEDISKIKNLFDLLDEKGEGIFYPNEFKSYMEQLGLHEKEPFIYSIINELNTEQVEKKGITYDELINAIDNKLGNKNSKEEIKKIFELFADEKSNNITILSLKKAGNKSGYKLSNEQYKLLMEKASKSGNEITFDEFYKIMTRNN